MTVERTKARVVISGVTPEIDCGLYPIKRTIGEEVVVEVRWPPPTATTS